MEFTIYIWPRLTHHDHIKLSFRWSISWIPLFVSPMLTGSISSIKHFRIWKNSSKLSTGTPGFHHRRYSAPLMTAISGSFFSVLLINIPIVRQRRPRTNLIECAVQESLYFHDIFTIPFKHFIFSDHFHLFKLPKFK